MNLTRVFVPGNNASNMVISNHDMTPVSWNIVGLRIKWRAKRRCSGEPMKAMSRTGQGHVRGFHWLMPLGGGCGFFWGTSFPPYIVWPHPSPFLQTQENKMKTSEKYKKMGFTEISDTKVKDRHGTIFFPKKSKSPLQAIKLFCRECQGMDRRKQAQVENVELVRECTDPMCPLFDFRLGKNPFHRRIMSEDQKKAASARLSMMRRTG